MPTARDMGVDRMGNDERAGPPDRFSARRRAASQARADGHPAAANENRPGPAPGTTAYPGPPGSPHGMAGRHVRPCASCLVPVRPAARMDARDARPYRAGYLADLDMAWCRARARAGFRLLRRGAYLPGPGSQSGPCGPPPCPGRWASRTSRQDSTESGSISDAGELATTVHSVTRCSAGSKGRASERNSNADTHPG